ncbi:aminopeptidase P family protein [Dehalogenimonas sp. 4OHTPN]|uniref:Aminopeptidase P family protein n=1 Tax=Dehalogenimonas sp. 4OHTPN TaxID=3166643 RepID=A0AAU8GA06_9CHLR
MSTDFIQKFRGRFEVFGIDGLLINKPENIRYITGFTGSNGYVILTPVHTILATDFRYVEQANSEVPDLFGVRKIEGPVSQWFPPLIRDMGVNVLGIEAGFITIAEFDRFKGALEGSSSSAKLIPLNDMVEDFRAAKSKNEILQIESAARLTCEALVQVSERYMRPGISEKKLAWELEKYIREAGGELAFPVIVAGGPASALPHATPSDRPLQPNEPLVIDLGAKLNGYCGDLTRTFWLGNLDQHFMKLYNIVLQAQQIAIGGIESGMSATTADRLARECITSAGYGECFGHSLGHGIGLEVHEKPAIGPNSTGILTDGMVFTVEPGIYVTGWGGIRIEDDVVLENGRVKVLTHFPK